MKNPEIRQSLAKRNVEALENARPVFELLSRDFFRSWGLCVVLTDPQGFVISPGPLPLKCENKTECPTLRRMAIEESLRWGEASIQLCQEGYVVLAVPVMENSVVIGGLVAELVMMEGPEDGNTRLSASMVRRAANDLFTMAVESNLTNAAFMSIRKTETARESERAEAIHAVKDQRYDSIRDVYLKEEPALITAIKHGDRRAAREIINRVLSGIYFWGRERPELLKNLILELVVTMSRSAVEAGGDASELLGYNYSSISELAQTETEEELCAWLVSTLERIMDAIKTNRDYPNTVLLNEAIKYMRDHINEPLSRDDVADVACLSPSHFSRIVKQSYGQSFTDLLARMRVEKACEMLTYTSKSIIEVSIDCGFSDQSYFTKVFHKYTGMTPGDYKRSRRSHSSV